MKDVIKKALFLSALGCVLGVAIGLALWVIADPNALTEEEGIRSLITYLVVSGVYGALAMGASAVYDIEQRSIATATAVHFLVTLLGFYALGMIEGWLKFGDIIFYIMTVSFIVVYFVIWFIQYMAFRQKVNEMNEYLNKMKSEEKDQ